MEPSLRQALLIVLPLCLISGIVGAIFCLVSMVSDEVKIRDPLGGFLFCIIVSTVSAYYSRRALSSDS